MNTIWDRANTPNTIQFYQIPSQLQQNLNHIPPCITIRPNKRHQNLNSSSQKVNQTYKNQQQSLNLSIPKSKHPDMLWKTQMSQSFVEKLEIFQDQESLMIEKNKTDHSRKINFLKRINFVKGEIFDMRKFMKEVKEKVIEMHRVYSQGNRNSIELVMLIVKQLEKQNLILKQKLSLINSLHLSQSNKPTQLKDCMVQTEMNEYHQKDVTSPEIDDQIMQKTRIEHNYQAHEKQKQLCQGLDQNDNISASPVWSVLIGDHQLETIEELEHDDSTCSLQSKINPFNDGSNTFSSKLDVTDHLSAFNESHLESFNLEEVTNLFSEHHKTNFIDNQQKQFYVMNARQKHEELLVQKANSKQNSLNQLSLQEDQQENLILKKLLKLNKISHRKNSLSLTNSIPPPSIQSSETSQTQKPTLNQVFAAISIPTITLPQNPHSISEALTILKEYNQNHNFDPSFGENQKQNPKQQKVKGPGKISLCANKRLQNKENIRGSDQV